MDSKDETERTGASKASFEGRKALIGFALVCAFLVSEKNNFLSAHILVVESFSALFG